MKDDFDKPIVPFVKRFDSLSIVIFTTNDLDIDGDNRHENLLRVAIYPIADNSNNSGPISGPFYFAALGAVNWARIKTN